MSNLYNNTQIEQLINPVNATSTRTSTHTDTQGFYQCLVIVNMGLAFDALSGIRYWTISLQEGDTTGAFTNVANADTDNGAGSYVVDSSSEDEQAYVFSYNGSKRYVRVVVTATGTHSSGTAMSATAILAQPAVGPVA